MPIYSVQKSEKITPSTLLLTLQRDEHERPLSFQAGQYAAISFIHKGKKSPARCFSIVSSPTDQDNLEFSMRIRGGFTTALSKLKDDDAVEVVGPFGGFVMDVTRDKECVLLAGGIGITPFVSMMRYLSTIGADNQVTLFYSVQTQDDIPFEKELLSIQNKHNNLKTIFVIGNGPTDKLSQTNSVTGFISAELLDKRLNNYEEKKFFICGPPGFMKAMSGTLMKKGVIRKNIFTEAFTQSSPKQTSVLRSWPSNVYTLGAIGVFLGSFVVMVNDLLKLLPPSTVSLPSKESPFLVTNARQQKLDSLVNSIPPSASLINSSNNPTEIISSQPTVINSPPPNYAPIYVTPSPSSTTSAPPP